MEEEEERATKIIPQSLLKEGLPGIFEKHPLVFPCSLLDVRIKQNVFVALMITGLQQTKCFLYYFLHIFLNYLVEGLAFFYSRSDFKFT